MLAGAPADAAAGGPIYLDHHATTPVDPCVRDAMLPWLDSMFGNAGSAEHRFGWRAQQAVEAARAQVAGLVGAAPAEVVFTSGATEANNLALLGARLGPGAHVISTTIEHPSINACLAELARRGMRITRLEVAPDGLVCPAALAAAIRPETGLVSIQLANHEIGALQPVGEIGMLTRRHGILLHVDAAQAAGKVPMALGALQADLVSLSAHKLYGPQGIGALVVARAVRARLAPILHGGGQEQGLRPGTLPVPLIVGFGAAAAVAARALPTEAAHLALLRDALLARLGAIPGLRVHGGMAHRLAGNLNVGWPGLVARDLTYLLRDVVACSSGSACSSGELVPSPVLLAIGLDQAAALGGLRIGLGRFTTAAQVALAASAIVRAATGREGD